MTDGDGSAVYTRRGGEGDVHMGRTDSEHPVGKGRPWPQAPVAPVVSEPADVSV